MTPIFTMGCNGISERKRRVRMSLLESVCLRTGLLWLGLGGGFLFRDLGLGRLLFAGRLRRGSELHGTDEQSGKNSTTEQRVAEEFPRLRVTGRALGQRPQPAEKVLCVFRVAEWIEQ